MSEWLASREAYAVVSCSVSGPIAGITPQIDYSVHGKFTVQGESGNVLHLKPKVITIDDVAKPPPKGGTVQVVGRDQTILAEDR